MSLCVLVCVFKFFYEINGSTKAKFTWSHHGIRGVFIQMILVIVVLHFNIVSLHGVAVQGFKQGFKN